MKKLVAMQQTTEVTGTPLLGLLTRAHMPKDVEIKDGLIVVVDSPRVRLRKRYEPATELPPPVRTRKISVCSVCGSGICEWPVRREIEITEGDSNYAF